MAGKSLYGQKYYDLMLRQNSKSAETISKIRWDFVSKVSPKVVIDFGCGAGFFRAFAPKDVIVDTYDIFPEIAQTGIRHTKYDLLTMWDVFEHIPHDEMDLLSELLKATKYVALSVPVLPKGTSLFDWKHFKPGEHLYQFTPQSLEDIFRDFGFKKIKDGYPETKCGIREDIYSVIFQKVR